MPENLFSFPSSNLNANLLHPDPWFVCMCMGRGWETLGKNVPQLDVSLSHEFMHHCYNREV